MADQQFLICDFCGKLLPIDVHDPECELNEVASINGGAFCQNKNCELNSMKDREIICGNDIRIKRSLKNPNHWATIDKIDLPFEHQRMSYNPWSRRNLT